MIVVDGLDGYVVAAKDGNVLVCPVTDDQKVTEFTKGK